MKNKSNKFSEEEIKDFRNAIAKQFKEWEEEEEKKQQEWDNKSNEEKLAWYEENNVFLAKYIKMSKEELEEELALNKDMAEQLKGGFFHHPYYSYMGCLEDIERINKVKKLKGWN